MLQIDEILHSSLYLEVDLGQSGRVLPCLSAWLTLYCLHPDSCVGCLKRNLDFSQLIAWRKCLKFHAAGNKRMRTFLLRNREIENLALESMRSDAVERTCVFLLIRITKGSHHRKKSPFWKKIQRGGGHVRIQTVEAFFLLVHVLRWY